jgi:hypothetical protein
MTDHSPQAPSVLVPFPIFAYVAIIAIALLLRTLFTTYVELGGDALEHWYFAKLMSEHFNVSRFTDNHHDMRWATNAWPILYATIFGWSLQVYYLVPMLFFGLLLAASALFVRLLDQDLFPFVLFLVVFFAEPMFFRPTSQLLPIVFAAFFLMVAAIFLVRSATNGCQWTYALVALFFFLAYGAHENSLVFLPGACFFLLWNLGPRQGLRAIANIGIYGLLLMIAETITFDLVSAKPVTLGRFELLDQTFSRIKHKAIAKHNITSILDLTRPWRELPLYTSAIVVSGLIGGIYLAVRERIGREPIGASLPFFLLVSFFVFHTFLLQSIDPIIPLAPAKVKYLVNTTVWAAMSTALAANSLIENCRWPVPTDRLQAFTLFTVLLIGIASLFVVQYRGLPTPGALFWHARESYAPIAKAIKGGMPVLLDPGISPRQVHAFESWFSTDLVPINPDNKNAEFSVFTTPEAAVDPNREMRFCILLTDYKDLAARDWLVRCPSDALAKKAENQIRELQRRAPNEIATKLCVGNL